MRKLKLETISIDSLSVNVKVFFFFLFRLSYDLFKSSDMTKNRRDGG